MSVEVEKVCNRESVQVIGNLAPLTLWSFDELDEISHFFSYSHYRIPPPLYLSQHNQLN